MRAISLAAIVVCSFAASGSAFAQSDITCATIQASTTLSEPEQQALGRAAAARVAELRTTNAAAADELQNCIAAGPQALTLAFQGATGPAVGDITAIDDVDDDNQGDDVPSGGPSPASNS